VNHYVADLRIPFEFCYHIRLFCEVISTIILIPVHLMINDLG
jgi:hypothetical protein